MSIVAFAIYAIIAVCVIGIAYVVAKMSGVNIPPGFVQIFWIVIAGIVGIAAILILVHFARTYGAV